jgi:hypothetical protein
VTGKNRIMIFGPKTDGTYVVEFKNWPMNACLPRSRRTECGGPQGARYD